MPHAGFASQSHHHAPTFVWVVSSASLTLWCSRMIGHFSSRGPRSSRRKNNVSGGVRGCALSLLSARWEQRSVARAVQAGEFFVDFDGD